MRAAPRSAVPAETWDGAASAQYECEEVQAVCLVLLELRRTNKQTHKHTNTHSKKRTRRRHQVRRTPCATAWATWPPWHRPTDLENALAALHDAERDEEADDLDRDQQLVLHARGAEERRSRDAVKMQHAPCAVQPVPRNEFAGAAVVTQRIVQSMTVH